MVVPTLRAPGHKYQEQQPARATKLHHKVYGEERNIKITAPGLNKDRATGTLDPDAGTPLGEAQEQIQILVEDGATRTKGPETPTQLGAANTNSQTNRCHLSSYKQQEPNLAFTNPLKKIYNIFSNFLFPLFNFYFSSYFIIKVSTFNLS